MATPDQQARLTVVQKQLAYLKSELNGSINTIKIRDNVVLVVEALEYLLFGVTSAGDPNYVPGTPASRLEDPTATKVEFTSGPGAVAAAEAKRQQEQIASRPFIPTAPALAAPVQHGNPVTNGDTSFARSAPPPNSDVTFMPSAPGGSGQVTEYFDQQGRQIDINGNLIGQQQPPSIPGIPAFVHPAPPAPPAPRQPQQEQQPVLAEVPSTGGFAFAGQVHAPGVPQTREEMARMSPIPLAD